MSFELRDGSPQLVTLACLYSGVERPLQAAHAMGLSGDQKRDMLRVFQRHGLITDPTKLGFSITDWGRAVFEEHCLGPSVVSTVSIPPARWTPNPVPPDQRPSPSLPAPARRDRAATTRTPPFTTTGARKAG